MAENRVTIEGMNPISGSFPVMISGTLPPGTALPVAQAAPAASSAPLIGHVLAASAAGDQTLFSLSAGDIWYGFFTLAGALTGVSKVAEVSIECLGGSGAPSAGTNIVSLELATGSTGTPSNGTARTNYMYIYSGASDNDVHATVTGDASTVSATAYGYLLT